MYVAVGHIIKSSDKKLKVGGLIATVMSKKYPMSEPYTMMLLRDNVLVIVDVKWLEFVKIDKNTPQENIDKLERYLIEKWSKQRKLTDFTMS